MQRENAGPDTEWEMIIFHKDGYRDRWKMLLELIQRKAILLKICKCMNLCNFEKMMISATRCMGIMGSDFSPGAINCDNAEKR